MEQKLFFDIGILPVGKACDLKCKGCFWSSSQRLRFMKTSDPLFTHLQKIGIKKCFVGGGEPLLHPKIGGTLSGIAKKVSIRYLLTHGKNLSKHQPTILNCVDTLVISIDEMHKEAMREKDYPNEILSTIKTPNIHKKIRINSVIGRYSNLPFLLLLRDKIAPMKQIKNWHIYPLTPKAMSKEEYFKIIDSINASSPLNFKVEYKIPQSNFIQLLIYPNYSIESLSFNDDWSLKRKVIKNIFEFDALRSLLQHASGLHKINRSSCRQVGE